MMVDSKIWLAMIEQMAQEPDSEFLPLTCVMNLAKNSPQAIS